MSKIMALDVGDQWTGIAISDSLRFIAQPYTTVSTDNLENTLDKILQEENIEIIVIGHPKTLKGTESKQTKKTVEFKEKLEQKYKDFNFVLWDERLSSKRAESIQLRSVKSKEEKLKSHARAAAFILDSYLIFLSSQF